MKKALVILMALAMVFAAFADDPAWNFGITKFDGDATISYTIDLDAEAFGMDNAKTEAGIEFTLISKGAKATTGDGLWGELAIEGGEVKNGFNGLGNAAVKTAKIHFVDGDFSVAMDILGPNLKVGGGNANTATASAWALPAEKTVNMDPQKGFVIEIKAKDLFDANLSLADNGIVKSDAKKFGFKGDVTIKAIPDMNIYGGFAWAQTDNDFAYAAKFDYKLDLGGLKLIPAVGFAGKGDTKELSGAVLLSWGADPADVGFIKFANGTKTVADKCADGVSVAFKSLDNEFKNWGIMAGIYDSTAVAGLKVGADFAMSTVENSVKTINAAVKYATEFDIFKFGADFGAKILLGNDTNMGFVYAANIATDGIIQNTTLKAEYAGENAAKAGGADIKGKIILSAKIHF